jgi:hypothetical protein
VLDELLGPGVEDSKHADGAADEAVVVGKRDDGVGRSLHQQGVAVTLVGAQQRSQLLRHRDGDVEIIGRQHLGLAGFEPGVALLGVAFGTGAVFAGVLREHLVAALIAAPQVSAAGLGTASQDVGDGTAMRGWHRRTMGRQIAVREPAEDVGKLDHGD